MANNEIFKEQEIEDVECEEMETNNLQQEDKPNANLLDLLLSADLSNFKVKSKKVEIPRLSKAMGSPFIVELRVVPINLEQEIEDRNNKIEWDDEGNPSVDAKPLEQRKTILTECVFVEGKQLFKQKNLMVKFNAKTPIHLVEKLLTKGEISKLYDSYKKLIGFKKGTIEDIKN